MRFNCCRPWAWNSHAFNQNMLTLSGTEANPETQGWGLRYYHMLVPKGGGKDFKARMLVNSFTPLASQMALWPSVTIANLDKVRSAIIARIEESPSTTPGKTATPPAWISFVLFIYKEDKWCNAMEASCCASRGLDFSKSMRGGMTCKNLYVYLISSFITKLNNTLAACTHASCALLLRTSTMWGIVPALTILTLFWFGTDCGSYIPPDSNMFWLL